MQRHWGRENTTHTLDTGTPGKITRALITHELLRASKKDCNDSRHRFIPRAKLVDIINAELVEQLLQEIPGVCAEDVSHRQDAVQHISPRPGECSCGCRHCTGRRMILATLFLCGREDLILSFLPPAKHQTCDKNLPFLLNSAEAFDYGLNAEERELFTHFKWHVYTPFIHGITSERRGFAAFREEVSLPWMEKSRIGDQVSGEVSYVEKIEIHYPNHDLVSCTVEPSRSVGLRSNLWRTQDTDNVFALKTFEQRLVPGMSEDRFRHEVDANLDAPKHERIVRLLTAFSYREKFYLVFPLATEGSLEKLWKSYIPEGIDQSEQPTPPENPEQPTPAIEPEERTPARVAHWYSDEWLIGECLGIAEALLATHALPGDHPEGTSGLLHADLKPENILCFPKSERGKPSIVLKLADFGEAKRVKPNVDLKAGKVAHVKTYRPPEHATGNIITLNYDVWCLGCLFLDFVTWAILGQDGIDSFNERRESEEDEAAVTENPGQIIEDTFFKRTKQESVPFILKRLQWGRSCEMKVASRRATTTYSLWAASHVNITSQLKSAVVSVSEHCSYFRCLHGSIHARS